MRGPTEPSMIRFVVHNEQGRASEFTPRHTSIVGKDELAIPGTVLFEDGHIVCHKQNPDAAALSLQIDVGASGTLTLQTCLLPDRDEPYSLELELARHRIMLLLNKLEDWSLAMLAPDHPVMVKLEEARDLFTQALTTPHSTEAASAEQASIARRALSIGVEAGEEMCKVQSERELLGRFAAIEQQNESGSGESGSDSFRPHHFVVKKPLLGCSVPSGRFAEPLQRILSKSCDFLTCPMPWGELEAKEGRRSFGSSDRWIEWAVRKGKLPVIGGPIIDLRRRSLPDWIYIWENDYKTLRELAYEHLKAVVTRYRRAVQRWNVLSGANINAVFQLRHEEMIDLTRLCVLTTRKLQPSAKIFVEIDQPFGEHATHLERSIPPFLYTGLLLESGVQIDGFAVRVQMGDGEPGRSCRDLLQLSAFLDTLARFERPIHLTAIGVPSRPVEGRVPDPDSAIEEQLADDIGWPGQWRREWSGDLQADWLTRVVTIAAGKPTIETICWQMLFDNEDGPEMRSGGLINRKGGAKSSLRRLGEVAGALRAQKPPSWLPMLTEPAPESSVEDATAEGTSGGSAVGASAIA